jgi:hypothetical protein
MSPERCDGGAAPITTQRSRDRGLSDRVFSLRYLLHIDSAKQMVRIKA